MDSFGLERSIEPRHALAQQAWKIDNTMTLRSDEVLIDVKIININLASFNEILDETGEDRALLCQRVLEIVRERGKLHNPVTNSGGMLYGTVVELGPSYPNIYHIRPKDEIISLSSLTVTPLHITQILRIDCESAQLEVEGQAILYANSPVVKKPPDLPLRAVIAAMDEAGAPTRSYQIVQPGQDVLILGASGRIGLMCGYAAKDKMGSSGRLVGIVRDQESRIQMEPCSVFDEVLELDATNLSALCGTPHAEIIQRFDVVINCINTADTEAASLLAVKNHGTIYFATICCDYKFVALTAESIGKEIQVIPYTGFLEGHADYTLGLMRRFPQMQTDIQRGICGVPETISIPNSDETPHAKSEADEDCASGYIFHSLEAKATLRQALKVARYTSNVMIYGESGVGKEIIARIIHQNSERKSFPMVKINCAAIPEHLLESELFGYEKGSFTGANIKGKIGLWEAAQNGTLFLDEVGELPLTFQAKLLRVIQEKEIVRVGGLTPIKVDVRIIAATNRNLARMVQAGEFREDLYYRLNVYPITVLPLRMRRADIIPLEALRASMLHMEPTIAQILLDNLAACKSLDSYDIAFRKAISTFEDDRIRHITEAINQRKLSFLVGELNHKLFSPDLFQWLAIWNRGRSKISKSAERISQLAEKQARELEWNEDSFQSMFAVVTHITGDGIPKSPIYRREELNLLLLFKYCLDAEQKASVLRDYTV